MQLSTTKNEWENQQAIMLPADLDSTLADLLAAVPASGYFLAQAELLEDFLNAPNYSEDRIMFETAIQVLLEGVESVQDLDNLEQYLDGEYLKRRGRVRRNEAACVESIYEYEQTITAGWTYFLNADIGGKSVNTSFYNIDPARFSGEKDTDFLDFLEEYLTSRFESFEMEESPDVVIVVGDLIRDKGILRRLCEVCEKTGALLLGDFKPFTSLKTLMSHAERASFTDGDGAMGHGILSSAWGKGREAYTEIGETKDQPLPTAAAIGGVMNRLGPAKLPAGFANGVLRGVRDIWFQTNRRITEMLQQLGMFALAKVKGEIRAFGGRTLNTSGDQEFKYINTIRVRNALTKTLMQYAAEIAYTDMGSEEEQGLYNAVTAFLNTCKSEELIRDYREPKITRDPNKPEIINISVEISYRDPAIYFSIDVSRQDANEQKD